MERSGSGVSAYLRQGGNEHGVLFHISLPPPHPRYQVPSPSYYILVLAVSGILVGVPAVAGVHPVAGKPVSVGDPGFSGVPADFADDPAFAGVHPIAGKPDVVGYPGFSGVSADFATALLVLQHNFVGNLL